MSYQPPPQPGSHIYASPYGRPPGPPTQPSQPGVYQQPLYSTPSGVQPPGGISAGYAAGPYGAPRAPGPSTSTPGPSYAYPTPGSGAPSTVGATGAAPYSTPGGFRQTMSPPQSVGMTVASPPPSAPGMGYAQPYPSGAGTAQPGGYAAPGPPSGTPGNGYYTGSGSAPPTGSSPSMPPPPTTYGAKPPGSVPAFAPPPTGPPSSSMYPQPPGGGGPQPPKFYGMPPAAPSSTGGTGTPSHMSMPPPPSSSMSMPPPPTGMSMGPPPTGAYQQQQPPTGGYAPPPPGPYGQQRGLDGSYGQGSAVPPGPGGYVPPPGQGQYGQPAPPQTPGSRVDPAQIPRPAEAQDLVTFYTVANGDKAPPSVARKFVVVDDGNCSPRFMRATTYYVPQTKDLANQTKLPVAVICRPLAPPEEGEEEVPVVDYGDIGPVRCTRCKAYINSFVTFLEHGAKWSCNICGMVNDVPPSYQCSIDPQGQRRDRDVRPEFSRGSVEFVVGKEYCVREKQEPIYVFALDVSPTAVSSGMMRAALDAIAASLDSLPGGDKVRVGILTFASKLQFYQPASDPDEPPAVMLVGDVDEPFGALPPDRWITQDRERFRRLLDQIPDLSATSDAISESASVAALEAVADALSVLGGRAIIFTASRPNKGAGALKLRADPRDYGTDREQLLYCPVGSVSKAKDDKPLADYYQRLGDSLSGKQINVDIFVCSESGEFVDAATLGKLTHMTAGRVHFYPGPVASPHNIMKFESEVRHCLLRRAGNETMCKVRTSLGVGVKGYLTRGAERLGGELELAQVNESTTMAVELMHDGEKIKEGSKVHVQLAVLHTTVEGRRLVRVHNLALPVATSVSSVFRYADLEAVLTYMVKAAIWQAWSDPLPAVRENITKQCVDILYQYRTTCAVNSPPGQLILPESLKLLPLYALALIKSDALRLNSMEAGRAHGIPDPSADERAAALHLLFSLPEKELMHAIYPRLYAVQGLPPSGGPIVMERLGQCSAEALQPGVYVLDTLTTFYLYLARDVPRETLSALFGIESIPMDSHMASFYLGLVEGSEPAQELANQLAELALDRKVTAPVVVVVGGSGSAVESHFVKLLVDDRSKVDQSYVEYLCTVHKQIQTKVNR